MSLAETKRNWHEFGRRDPLWAILTKPGTQGGQWDVDKFFEGGRDEINDVLKYVEGLGLCRQKRRALDFGCGVGRLTQALTNHFLEVVGVDIAPSMIKLARQYNRHNNCRYYQNDTDSLHIFPDNHFDFIYSMIVLQHIEPVHTKNYLREFARILAPSGVLVFQLPAAGPETQPEPCQSGQIQRLKDWLWPPTPQMEMHPIPEQEVREVLPLRIVDVVETDSSGPEYLSLRYCAVKD